MTFELTADQTASLRAIAKNRKHVKARQAIELQGEAFPSRYVTVNSASRSAVRLAGGRRAIPNNLALRGDKVGFAGVTSVVMLESQITLQNSVFCAAPHGDPIPGPQAEPLLRIQFLRATARSTLQQQARRQVRVRRWKGTQGVCAGSAVSFPSGGTPTRTSTMH